MTSISTIVYTCLCEGCGVDDIQGELYDKIGHLYHRDDVIKISKRILGLDNESRLIEFRDELISEGVTFFDVVFSGLARIENIKKFDPEVTPDATGFVDRLIQGPRLDALHHILDVLKRYKYDLYLKYTKDSVNAMVSIVESYISWLTDIHVLIQHLFIQYLDEEIDLDNLEEDLNGFFKTLEEKWFDSLGSSFNLI